MASDSFHSSNSVSFDTVRSGLWLCIDLIDDMREWSDDVDYTTALEVARTKVMDTLFLMRRIEEDALPGQTPLRLQPGWPAA